MKKRAILFLSLLMAVVLLIPAAVAESGDSLAESLFESYWVNDDMRIEIAHDEAGSGFVVTVIRPEFERSGSCWQYTCVFDEASETLVDEGAGVRYSISYDDEGVMTLGNKMYEDGAAVFSLNEEGLLIWEDQKEDAGQGLDFMDIGLYDGTAWTSGNTSVEIFWEEEGYKVFIHRDLSETAASEWMFSCYYDPETDGLIDLGMGRKTDLVYGTGGELASFTDVYDDGAATFTVDEHGHLIWEDAKEQAGIGLEFELEAY